jgi:hypothetical protein
MAAKKSAKKPAKKTKTTKKAGKTAKKSAKRKAGKKPAKKAASKAPRRAAAKRSSGGRAKAAPKAAPPAGVPSMLGGAPTSSHGLDSPRLLGKSTDDLSEHPNVPPQALGEQATCSLVVEYTLLVETHPKSLPQEENQVLKGRTEVQGHCTYRDTDLLRARGEGRSRDVVIEHAAHLKAHVCAYSLEGGFDRQQAVSFRQQAIVPL